MLASPQCAYDVAVALDFIHFVAGRHARPPPPQLPQEAAHEIELARAETGAPVETGGQMHRRFKLLIRLFFDDPFRPLTSDHVRFILAPKQPI